MGASRQSQDIFKMLKKRNYSGAWYFIKHFNKLTYEDTFMPIVCKIKGHKPYEADEPNEWACKRCHTYIKYNPRLEKLKRLKKISK